MSLATWEDGLERQKVQTALARAMRWSAYDVEKMRPTKVLVGTSPCGLTNRDGAEWALNHQFRYDPAGLARRRAGVAIVLSPTDADRYRQWLQGICVHLLSRA
jgi:hypothetical protein